MGAQGDDIVVMDSAKDKAFYLWNRKTLEKKSHAKGDVDGDTHLAVLAKRKDGPTPIRFTPDLIALANADGMSSEQEAR